MGIIDDLKTKATDAMKDPELVKKAEAMAAEHGITKEEAMAKIQETMKKDDK